MKFINTLFWQPQSNYYQIIASSVAGKILLISSNYVTWIFLIYPSYLLVKHNPNIFWQLLFATILGEILEKTIKLKGFWKRPAFINNAQVPDGLIKSWYLTGSFPSGHTIKAAFFLLFLLQYQLFFLAFIIIIVPLLLFRIMIGFHYPIDLLGGIFLGIIIWLLTRYIQMPLFLNQFIQNIFLFIFSYPIKIGI
jgi:membrane-associated phospholipid phosphatase